MLIKQKKEYINDQSLCRQEDIDTIIPLHIMTGSDHTSAFYGVGKKVVADRVSKSAEARNLLISCGASLDLTDEAIADMSTFVTKYVYNDKNSITPAAARAAKWRCQKIKSITRMIPDSESLLHQFKRVNYMVYIQKNFHLKEHPSPLLHGWNIENGLCLPTRSALPALPRVMPYQMELSDDHSDGDSESYSDIISDEEDFDESCGSDYFSTDSDSD